MPCKKPIGKARVRVCVGDEWNPIKTVTAQVIYHPRGCMGASTEHLDFEPSDNGFSGWGVLERLLARGIRARVVRLENGSQGIIFPADLGVPLILAIEALEDNATIRWRRVYVKLVRGKLVVFRA